MPKRRSTVAVLALGLVLGASSLAFTQDKPPKPERGERHPQIHAAMRALNVAARHLVHAEGELKQALEYAKEHPEEGGKPAARRAPAPAGGATTTPAPKTQ